jgi:hypothetical protein
MVATLVTSTDPPGRSSSSARRTARLGSIETGPVELGRPNRLPGVTVIVLLHRPPRD